MELPNFHTPNYCYRTTVVRVIDGDTMDVDLDVGFNTTMRKRLRFMGMNAWEIKGEEKGKGLMAKMFLEQLIESADQVVVQTVMDAKGKYGRVLAYVWVLKDNAVLNVNQLLVEEGHARESK